jgi:hypothetical protein
LPTTSTSLGPLDSITSDDEPRMIGPNLSANCSHVLNDMWTLQSCGDIEIRGYISNLTKSSRSKDEREVTDR